MRQVLSVFINLLCVFLIDKLKQYFLLGIFFSISGDNIILETSTNSSIKIYIDYYIEVSETRDIYVI